MRLVHGNILDVSQGILVHGVNMQGKFNAGLAKQIRQRYPQVYQDYLRAYERGLRLGDVIFTRVSATLIIASGVTQVYYGREPSVVYVNYRAVGEVFYQVASMARMTGLPVVHPAIGCGLAGGSWQEIEPLITQALHGLPESTLYVHDDP